MTKEAFVKNFETEKKRSIGNAVLYIASVDDSSFASDIEYYEALDTAADILGVSVEDILGYIQTVNDNSWNHDIAEIESQVESDREYRKYEAELIAEELRDELRRSDM